MSGIGIVRRGSVASGGRNLRVVEVLKSNNTAATLLISAALPAETIVGDLIVVFLACYNSNFTSVPATWTMHRNDNSGARERLHAAYWVSDTNAPGPVNFAVTGVLDSICLAAVLVRGAHPTSPINTSAFGGNTSASDTHVTPAVTPSVPGCLILRAVSSFGTSAAQTEHYTWPGEVIEIADYVGGPAADATPACVSVAMTENATTSAQGVVNATASASRNYGAMTLAIAPAS